MQEYTDMTFIWSEMTILQLWWDQAHPTKQRALRNLINSGRFEITTGGWVNTYIWSIEFGIWIHLINLVYFKNMRIGDD